MIPFLKVIRKANFLHIVHKYIHREYKSTVGILNTSVMSMVSSGNRGEWGKANIRGLYFIVSILFPKPGGKCIGLHYIISSFGMLERFLFF